jgi:predicted ATP-binding protein involved in virulence
MRIRTLFVKNYRRFDERSLLFQERFTVIIGNNASGKTAVMDALSFCLGCFIRGLDTIYQSQQSDSPRSINAEDVRIAPGIGTEKREQLPVIIEAQGQILDMEDIKWGGRQEKMDRKKNKVILDKGAKKIGLLARNAQAIARNEHNSESLTLPLIAYFGPERLGTAHRLTSRKSGEVKEYVPFAAQGARLEGYVNCLSVKSSGKQFKSWFKTLSDRAKLFNDPTDFQQINTFSNTISKVVPQWQDIAYDFANDEFVGYFKESDDKIVYLPLSSLSNGYQNFIGIIADLTYRCIKLNPHLKDKAVELTPGVVLIDELDLHLHPIWQRAVVAGLKAAFPNTQFIATTHSPFIVQSLNAKELINLDDGPALAGNPQDRTIEDTILFMGTPSERSSIFEQKAQFAEKFLKAIQDGELPNALETALHEELEKFSDDPAFVAHLKIEKLFKTAQK